MSAWPDKLYGCFRGEFWLQTKIDNVQLGTMDVDLEMLRKRIRFDKLPTHASSK